MRRACGSSGLASFMLKNGPFPPAESQAKVNGGLHGATRSSRGEKKKKKTEKGSMKEVEAESGDL